MPRPVVISASLLAADFAHLADSVQGLVDGGVDELHFDVMDGQFVPNISIGLPVLEAVSPLSDLPVDVHMMVNEPGRYASAFAEAGGDIFTVHVEACEDPWGAIAAARDAGMRPAVSVKPGTPVSDIAGLVGDVDRVLVMTVEPGFGGQSLMKEALPKIRELAELADRERVDLEIAVDGGVKTENAGEVASYGATTFISGTGLFNHPGGIRAAVVEMRAAVRSVVTGQ